MNIPGSLVWPIDKYARLTRSIPSGTDDQCQWKYFDDSLTPMMLMLTVHDILVLVQGSIVLESFNLGLNGSALRGLVRTDSLLLAYKCASNTRRFRLRFKPKDGKPGSQICGECVDKLSSFFVIKRYASDKTQESKSEKSPAKQQTGASPTHDNIKRVARGEENMQVDNTIIQEVTFGQVAKCVLSEQTLGLAYQGDTDPTATTTTHRIDDPTMLQLVRLCFLDPGFPAFVSRVEKAVCNVTSTLSKGPTNLLRKGQPTKVEWGEAQERAYTSLKQRWSLDESLPDFDIEFVLSTDAAGRAVGCLLGQLVNGKLHPIAFATRKLLPREENGYITENECLTIIWAVNKFALYLYGKLITDHLNF